MSAAIIQALTFSAVPVASAVVGSIVAGLKPPSPRVRSYLQHFAAGVVFSALAVEILPDVVHRRAPLAAILGFAAGVGLMLLIRDLASKDDADAETRKGSASLVASVGVDILIDGLLLGVAFVAGEKAGVLLAVALATELLSLGLATVSSLMRSGKTRLRSVGLTSAIALLLPVGAVLGTVFVSQLSGGWMEAVLSFAAASLLYLVTEELLVEAHEVPETPLTTAMFFVGFLALLILDMTA